MLRTGETLDRKTKKELIARLNRDGAIIAAHFGLRYRSIEAERANVKNRYGICYEDGTIKIRLRHVNTGKPLKYSSLIATLCHELAHLRHFNHGERFRAFNAQVLEFARREGLYRPRRPGPAPKTPAPRRQAPPAVVVEQPAKRVVRSGPEQLSLF